MTFLNNTDRYLSHIIEQVVTDRGGAVADYIPELAAVDADGYALSLCVYDGYLYSHGDSDVEFTIQSASKPLTYAMALARCGVDAVDDKLGVEPSGEAFNQISVDDRGRPKNSMINVGAILTASLLLPVADELRPDSVDTAFDGVLEFYSACAGRRLSLDHAVYASEAATGSRNRALVYLLDSFGVVDTDPDAALDLYTRQCSVAVTCDDLAVIGATIAEGGVNPRTGREVFVPEVARRLLSVMTTCGMYDAAGDWVSEVGMPAKSGVGGGVLAALPGQLGIGVYSPRLDEHGNSVRGVDTCRRLSRDLGLHMFNVTRQSRVTIRDAYDLATSDGDGPQDRIRVYALQGDLTFVGVERAQRRISAEADSFDVAIIDITLTGVVDAVARTMLLAFGWSARAMGKCVVIVDPANVLRASVERHRHDSVIPDIDAPTSLRGRDPTLTDVVASIDQAVAMCGPAGQGRPGADSGE